MVDRMKRFVESNGEILIWGGRWEYALHSGQGVFGKLQLTEKDGTRALAESADGRWMFEKKWFPTNKVLLRLPNSDSEFAVFKTKVFEKRSSLEFRDGHVFYWMTTNFWHNKYRFIDTYNQELICFSRHSNPFAAIAMAKALSRGRVKIENRALGIPEIGLLVLLGCYLMVLESI
jgi:hypothetical protein